MIALWGTSAVVTVMTQDELAMLKVPELGQEVKARGLEWYQLAVLDAGVPNAAFETYWPTRGTDCVGRYAMASGF